MPDDNIREITERALMSHGPLDDPHYQRDITEAGRRAQSMRRGGSLARVLWLLNEKASWQLEISALIVDLLRDGDAEIEKRLEAIITKLNEGSTVDLGPVIALLQEILATLSGGEDEEPGMAESLNLTFDPPTDNS